MLQSSIPPDSIWNGIWTGELAEILLKGTLNSMRDGISWKDHIKNTVYQYLFFIFLSLSIYMYFVDYYKNTVDIHSTTT